ncbi:MAG: hypothetical protein VX644_07565 [Planctomycetota bacterium]|nr:hypothetical protein [Planctomycetota bacterium]
MKNRQLIASFSGVEHGQGAADVAGVIPGDWLVARDHWPYLGGECSDLSSVALGADRG